jgi:hypothetical protein
MPYVVISDDEIEQAQKQEQPVSKGFRVISDEEFAAAEKPPVVKAPVKIALPPAATEEELAAVRPARLGQPEPDVISTMKPFITTDWLGKPSIGTVVHHPDPVKAQAALNIAHRFEEEANAPPPDHRIVEELAHPAEHVDMARVPFTMRAPEAPEATPREGEFLARGKDLSAKSNTLEIQGKQVQALYDDLKASQEKVDRTSQTSVDAFNTKVETFNQKAKQYHDDVNSFNLYVSKGAEPSWPVADRAAEVSKILQANHVQVPSDAIYDNFDAITKQLGLRGTPTGKEIINNPYMMAFWLPLMAPTAAIYGAGTGISALAGAAREGAGIVQAGMSAEEAAGAVNTAFDLARSGIAKEILGGAPSKIQMAKDVLKGAAGFGTFMGAAEAENFAASKISGKPYTFGGGRGLADINDAEGWQASVLDAVDFMGQIWAAGKVHGGSQKAFEAATTKTFEQYNMPRRVFLDPAKIHDILGAGQEATAEEKELYGALGRSGPQMRQDLIGGTWIEMPVEKAVTVADRPWWRKIKSAIHVPPYSDTQVAAAGQPKVVPFELKGAVEGVSTYPRQTPGMPETRPTSEEGPPPATPPSPAAGPSAVGGTPLPPSFFDQATRGLERGETTLDHIRAVRDQYAASPQAHAPSVTALDQFIQAHEAIRNSSPEAIIADVGSKGLPPDVANKEIIDRIAELPLTVPVEAPMAPLGMAPLTPAMQPLGEPTAPIEAGIKEASQKPAEEEPAGAPKPTIPTTPQKTTGGPSEAKLPASALVSSQETEGNASTSQGSSNTGPADVQNIRDLSQSSTFLQKGFGGLDVPSQRIMMGAVINALHDPKVRDFVIESVPVNVVDHLTSVKSPTKMTFHDDSVLGNALTVNPDKTVSLGINTASSLINRIAGFTTEPPSSIIEGRGRNVEPLAASEAIHPDLVVEKSSFAQPGTEEESSLASSDQARGAVNYGSTSTTKEIRHNKERVSKSEEEVKQVLAGNQPIHQLTFSEPEVRGGRLALGEEKQTAEQIGERLKPRRKEPPTFSIEEEGNEGRTENNLPDVTERNTLLSERYSSAIKKVQEILGTHLEGFVQDHVKIPVELTAEHRKIATDAKSYGIDAYFFDGSESAIKIGGFTLPQEPTVLYLNTNARDVAATAQHEIMHTLQHSRPDIYEPLLEEVKPYLRNLDIYKKKLQADYEGTGMLESQRTRVMGDLIAQFAAGRELESMTTDPKAVKSAVDKALIEYKKTGGRTGSKGPPVFNAGAKDIAPTFYSKMYRVLDAKLPGTGTPESYRTLIESWANKGEYKADELKWSGLVPWLDGRTGKVTKGEIADFLKENQVQMKEVVKGGEGQERLQKAEQAFIRQAQNEHFTDSGARDTALDIARGDRTPNELSSTLEPLAKELRAAYEDRNETKQSPTKFSAYTLPMGENYREMLFTLPSKEDTGVKSKEGRLTEIRARLEEIRNLPASEVGAEEQRLWAEQGRLQKSNIYEGKYASPHWDEPNVLAHVRFNDRVDADGKKVLFIEEVQSDWHQEGKKKGYTKPLRIEEYTIDSEEAAEISGRPIGTKMFMALDEEGHLYASGPKRENVEQTGNNLYAAQTVPPAPFSKTWPELVMKRMLRWASENGYDRIAFTTGEQQAERYDLSKQIDRIQYDDYGDDQYWVRAIKDGDVVLHEDNVDIKRVSDLFGKEIADKIAASEGKSVMDEDGMKLKSLSGLDLKVGGEGMKGFYDTMLPAFMNKYAKQWGAKVGETKVDTSEGWAPVTYHDTSDMTGRPEVTREDLEKVYKLSRGYGNTKVSPITGEKLMYSIERVAITRASESVLHVMDRGKSLIEAMNEDGSQDLAEILGLEVAEGVPEKKLTAVHSLDITPSMKQDVLYKGQPRFSIQESLDAIKEAGNDAKAAYPHLEKIATHVYQEGARTWKDFLDRMKEVLGDLYKRFMFSMKKVFEAAKKAYAESPLANERGEVVLKDKDLPPLLQDFLDNIGKEREAEKGPERPKTFFSPVIEPVKTALNDLKEAYKKPPVSTESKRIIGRYTGALQRLEWQLTKLAKQINAEIPEKRQVAISNYIEAGGDNATLQAWADDSKAPYKQGYLDAMKLTPEEHAWAEKCSQDMQDTWQAANDSGLEIDYVENYVRHQWKDKPEKAGKKIISQINAGVFKTNPREALHRIWANYHEGEKLGYDPTDKRIGYQVVAHERSIREAMLARQALKELMASTEADGRPTVVVGGMGEPIQKTSYAVMRGDKDRAFRVFDSKDEAEKFIEGNKTTPMFGEKVPSIGDHIVERDNSAFAVKPNVKGKDWYDDQGREIYRPLDHPALRKWKWLGNDVNGHPVLMQGNMRIHRDAFGRLNALLGKSKIQTFEIPAKVPVVGGWQPGRTALHGGAFIKGTILIGPFHQFHLGEHAVFHKVNPFVAPEIDFDTRPLLREGVDHGLMLYSGKAMQEFAEGMASGGLWNRIPLVGDALKHYQEWLFQDYIPRLKALMFEHAVGRALKYYAKDMASGKFTRDQLLDNAAKQANAAFGELNYKYLSRNPTLQDVLRIGLLAPDFLEARLKFFAQAARPKGKEQFMALLRGAIIMATAAQVTNMLIGDDHKTHWNRPFSVMVGGREYTPRSVVGDMMHLVTDPRGFWYHRINPLWGRPLVEVATGRDFYGKRMGTMELVKDILSSWVPIPGQGLLKSNTGETTLGKIVNGLLGSVGISNYKYMSDFEKYAQNLEGPSFPSTDKSKLKSKLTQAVKENDPTANAQIRQAIRKHKLTPSDMESIHEKAKEPPAVAAAKRITLEQLATGIDKATPEEKKAIKPIFYNKFSNAVEKNELTKDEIEKYRKILRTM